MIVVKILDVKKFMAGFLAGSMLDSYRMASGSLTTFCTFRIDGNYHKDFFQDTPAQDAEVISSPASGINSSAVSSAPNDRSRMQGNSSPSGASAAAPLEETGTVFVPWKDVRPFCFSIVRGKHTPLAFKFVFYYPAEEVPKFCQKNSLSFDQENALGLCLNLKFDRNGLFLTTGISRKSFSMDRSVDEVWDRFVQARLQKLDISFEKV